MSDALTGKTDGGNHFAVIGAEGEGHLEVSVQNPRAAFGELLAVAPVPVAQFDFVYGLNADITASTVTGSGTVTSASGMVLCTTTAAINSTAQCTSRRYHKYRSGQGGLGRFTALYTAGAVGSKQYAGLGTSSLQNGLFFGYNDAAFGVCRISGNTENWTAQTAWNQDTCDGSGGSLNRSGLLLDPAKGNVYQIKYQYLGFGNLYYYVLNPLNGQWVLVHMEKYPNSASATVPNLAQPSFNIIWRAANTSNATSIVTKGVSGALFIEGERRLLGPTRGIDNNKASVTTATNVVTLKNATTFNTITNRAQVHLRSVSFGANAAGAPAGIATLRVIRNTTLGGTPSYTAIAGTTGDGGVTITSGTSPVSYDTAGTTITGGTIEFNGIAAIGNSAVLDMNAMNLFLNPGDTLTFAITSTAAATVGVGVSWTEDL